MTLIAAWHRDGVAYLISDTAVTTSRSAPPFSSSFGEPPKSDAGRNTFEGAAKVYRIRDAVIAGVAGNLAEAHAFMDEVRAHSAERVEDAVQDVAAYMHTEERALFCVLFAGNRGDQSSFVTMFHSRTKVLTQIPELMEGISLADAAAIFDCETEAETEAVARSLGVPPIVNFVAQLPVIGSVPDEQVALLRTVTGITTANERDSGERALAMVTAFAQGLVVNEAPLQYHEWGGAIVGGRVVAREVHWMRPTTYYLYDTIVVEPIQNERQERPATASGLQRIAVTVDDGGITAESTISGRIVLAADEPGNRPDTAIMAQPVNSQFVAFIRTAHRLVLVVDRTVDANRFYQERDGQLLLHPRLVAQLSKNGLLVGLSHLSPA